MTGSDGSDERRVSSLRELPRAIEPARDLWPQIEARVKDIQAAAPAATGATIPPHRSGARLRWLAAAAMVASVAVGVWIGRDLLPNASPLTVRQPPATGVTDVAYVSDPRYQHQRAALLRELQAQLATMPPQTRDKVTSSLAAIQKAKADLEEALGKDPGNALLQELLVNTYQDEMRVLTDVHEASNPGRGI
jgi:hypothetical protein